MEYHTTYRLGFSPMSVFEEYIIWQVRTVGVELKLTASSIRFINSPPFPPSIMLQLNAAMPSRAGELQPLCHIATPVRMLGYGLEEEQFGNTLECLTSVSLPRAIILDSGSTDGGP